MGAIAIDTNVTNVQNILITMTVDQLAIQDPCTRTLTG